MILPGSAQRRRAQPTPDDAISTAISTALENLPATRPTSSAARKPRVTLCRLAAHRPIGTDWKDGTP